MNSQFHRLPFLIEVGIFQIRKNLIYGITIVILRIQLKFTKVVHVQLTHKIPSYIKKDNQCQPMAMK